MSHNCEFSIISLNPSRIKKHEYFRFVQLVKKGWDTFLLLMNIFFFRMRYVYFPKIFRYSSYPTVLSSKNKFSTVLTPTKLIEIVIVCWDYAVCRLREQWNAECQAIANINFARLMMTRISYLRLFIYSNLYTPPSPVYGRAYKLRFREWNHTVTADKILSPA